MPWIAFSACVTELIERRQAVLVMTEDTAVSWVRGVVIYVYEGFVVSVN